MLTKAFASDSCARRRVSPPTSHPRRPGGRSGVHVRMATLAPLAVRGLACPRLIEMDMAGVIFSSAVEACCYPNVFTRIVGYSDDKPDAAIVGCRPRAQNQVPILPAFQPIASSGAQSRLQSAGRIVIAGDPRPIAPALQGGEGLFLAGAFEQRLAFVCRHVDDADRHQPVDVDRFLASVLLGAKDRMRALAKGRSAATVAASAASGVPAELILAQAALETGWGRNRIVTAGGADSHNLFGIKAGADWRGPSTEVRTTEYVDGQPQTQVERFRVYDSYAAAFTDYARLLGGNPRYAGVVNAPSAEQAAYALQRGGYATDPAYADKLIGVMQMIGPVGRPQLAQL